MLLSELHAVNTTDLGLLDSCQENRGMRLTFCLPVRTQTISAAIVSHQK